MIKKVYQNLVAERNRIRIRILLNRLLSPVYSGRQFYCNCCNKSFRKFLPKGNIKRYNAECPFCGSLERTRLLLLYLNYETEIFRKKNLKVLHFAPEYSLFKILKKLDIEYIDGDLNLARARNVIDITNIRFPDNYFDFIICSHVLGHVPDEDKAVRELKRVLSYTGIALIMSLINLTSDVTSEDSNIITPEEKLKFYGEPDLFRLHGLDFSSRLQKQGFTVECIDYRRRLSEETLKKHSLGDGQRELIFKCTKAE
jgi:SAM-dependent methyltransferase